MEFKDLIKNRRIKLGLTLEDVGKIVGVSKATVQRWESGEISNMRRDKILLLAKALHTTPAYLMGWEAESKKESEMNQKLIELIDSLTEEQVAETLNYIEYLKSKDN